MKKLKLFNLILLITSFSFYQVASADNNKPFAIAIHGGAGTILKSKMTKEKEEAYHAKLEEALKSGYMVLKKGGSSVEAVQAAIVVMENSPLFNAGKGAVFAHDKTNKLDASIMDGKTLKAGAITGVTHIKNPIKLAADVMFNSKHVLLSGEGAEQFAKTQSNIEFVNSKYYYTNRRWNQLQDALKNDSFASNENTNNPAITYVQYTSEWPDDKKYGTVGAVALDQQGNLSAGTSTGGLTNKRYGRIGDSPIIGAGTYADNNACAISATGQGEYFIRAAVAHDICARAMYKKVGLQQAADEVLTKLTNMKAEGGVVGLSPKGQPIFSFNSEGMYRGYIDSNGKVYTAIFRK